MTDRELWQAVREELARVLAEAESAVHVLVEDCVVTLTGHVESRQLRERAEEAAKRVAAHHSVVNDLEVAVPWPARRSDGDIARDVVRALRDEPDLTPDALRVRVRDGCVTLTGEVEREQQKRRAEALALAVRGVHGIIDDIELQPAALSAQVRTHIRTALHAVAERESEDISVETAGSRVILRGRVHSRAEHDEVERAARRTPGVTAVEDHLTVAP